jgi:hypothetical protein
MMDNNKEYQIPELSSEDIVNRLEGCSPLQASKVLLDVELHDQRDSLALLNDIYSELESGGSLVDELVTPIGLNVLDSIITHKKFKLNKTGITASRLWSEIRGFQYTTTSINAEVHSARQQLEAIKAPDKFDRPKVTKRDLGKTKDTHFKGNVKAKSDIEVGNDGNNVDISRSRNQEGANWSTAVQTDHIVPVKALAARYGKNAFLTDQDITSIVDSDDNLSQISGDLNNLKDVNSYADMKNQKEDALVKKSRGEPLSSKEERLLNMTDETLENGIRTEEGSKQKSHSKAQNDAWDNIKNNKGDIATKASKQAAEQSKEQAFGHAVIMLIKPIFFELTDSIKNGLSEGVGAKNISQGLKVRFQRVMHYVKNEILPMFKQVFKDFFNNFAKILIEGVLGLVTGLFKSVMRIISEGFSALVSAFKILSKPAEEFSSAQKADAISKIFASTVVTFVIFYFESTILPYFPNDGFIKDICLSLLSGVASTIVVYLLDKVDLFSVKAELRTKRVKEVFEMRIQQIKENTDAFEHASIEALAKHKLQFRILAERLTKSIDGDKNVNADVEGVAEFMKVDLKIKSTDDFWALLENNNTLHIA